MSKRRRCCASVQPSSIARCPCKLFIAARSSRAPTAWRRDGPEHCLIPEALEMIGLQLVDARLQPCYAALRGAGCSFHDAVTGFYQFSWLRPQRVARLGTWQWLEPSMEIPPQRGHGALGPQNSSPSHRAMQIALPGANSGESRCNLHNATQQRWFCGYRGARASLGVRPTDKAQ